MDRRLLITWPSRGAGLEVLTVAATFVVLGFGFDLIGATAAFSAFLAGRLMSNVYLAWGCRGIL